MALSCAKQKSVEVETFEQAMEQFNAANNISKAWFEQKEAPKLKIYFGDNQVLEYNMMKVDFAVSGSSGKPTLRVDNNNSKGEDCKTFLKKVFGFTDQDFDADKAVIAEKIGIDSQVIAGCTQNNKLNVAMTALYRTIHGKDCAYTVKDNKLAKIDDTKIGKWSLDTAAFIKFVNQTPVNEEKKTLKELLCKAKVLKQVGADDQALPELKYGNIAESVLTSVPQKNPKRTISWVVWLIGAAAIVLLAAVGVLVWWLWKTKWSKAVKVSKESDTIETEELKKKPQDDSTELPVKTPSPFDALAQSGEVTIEDVLSTFDRVYNRKKSLAEEYNRELADAGDLAVKYAELEDNLQQWKALTTKSTLKDMLRGYDQLSERCSGYKLMAEYNDMKESISTVDDKLKDYNACCNLMEGNPKNLKGALKAAIEQYNNNQTVEGAVEFATKFEIKGGKEALSAEKVLEQHNTILEALESFKREVSDLCAMDELKLKNRYLFLMRAMEAVFPLLEAVDAEPKSSLEMMLRNIKTDIAMICTTRKFIRVASDSAQQIADFDGGWSEEIEAFNDNNKGYTISVEQAANDVKRLFDKPLAKVKRDEFTMVVVERLWSRFVERFYQSLSESGVDRQALVESALNIAFHAADFVDHMRNHTELIGRLNLELLLNEFDTERSSCYQFVHNHLEKSNQISNQVYELAQQLGVENLEIVAGRYKIDRVSND